MLAVVLAGIGAGGLAASLWLRRDRGGASLAARAGAAGRRWPPSPTYARFDAAVGAPCAGSTSRRAPCSALALALMLPSAPLSGLLFTLLGAALRERRARARGRRPPHARQHARRRCSARWLAGFVLLPRLGMEGSLFALAAATALVALLALPRARRRTPAAGARRCGSRRRPLSRSLLALFPFGLMRDALPAGPLARFGVDGARVGRVREGLTETVLVPAAATCCGEPRQLPAGHQRLLHVGHGRSSGQRYMKLFVYWPVALQPAARRALLDQLRRRHDRPGAGRHARACSSIDVVDISRDILELARVLFPPPGRDTARATRACACTSRTAASSCRRPRGAST